MDSKLTLILPVLGLILLALVPSGNAVIKCHVCNSKSDGECGDPFFHEDNPDTPKTSKFVQECASDATFCRKITQTVRDDSRVIRSCGTEEHEEGRECYSTVLEEYNTYVCACKNTPEQIAAGTPCNTATGLQLSLVGLVSTLVLARLVQ